MRGAMMTDIGPGTSPLRCSHAAMTGGFCGGLAGSGALDGLGESAETNAKVMTLHARARGIAHFRYFKVALL